MTQPSPFDPNQPVPPAPTAGPTPPAYPTYPAAPGYGAMPSAPQPRRVSPDTKTDTIWIFLAIVVPMLTFLLVPLIDFDGFIRAAVEAAQSGSDFQNAATFMSVSASATLVSILSYVIAAVSVVFTFLDWRELGKRGITERFHWAWSILGVVVGVGMLITIIGRTVVLRRQGLRAMTPVWVFVATVAVSIIIVIAIIVTVFVPMIQMLSQLS